MVRVLRFKVMIVVLLGVFFWGQTGPVMGQAAAGGGPARYTKAGNGVIKDHVTGLEWYVNPSPHNTWLEARDWAANLSVGGGGWRLPTLAELKAQYHKGASRVNMDPLFDLPGAYVWSGDLKDPEFAWGFAFYSGLEGFHSVKYGFGRVALAVRSPK